MELWTTWPRKGEWRKEKLTRLNWNGQKVGMKIRLLETKGRILIRSK